MYYKCMYVIQHITLERTPHCTHSFFLGVDMIFESESPSLVLMNIVSLL